MLQFSQTRQAARFTLYCTTNDRFPIKLVDVVELFMRELHAQNVRQHWFSPGREVPGPLRLESIDEIPVTVSPAWTGLGKLGTAANIVAEWVSDTACLLRLLVNRVDVIQVRDKYWAALVAWPVARVSGARFTIWLSFPYPQADIDRAANAGLAKRLYLPISGHLGQLILYRLAMRHADHCFVQTQEMKKSLLGFGVPAEKMTPVPMGITPRVMNFREQRRLGQPGADEQALIGRYIAPQTQTVFYLGTLDRDRELEIMVDAFAQVLIGAPQARLLLVGPESNPGDRQLLAQRASALGISDKVVFTGMLPIERAWQLLEHADVCWCPVLNNRVLRVGSPTKLIEYMAFEKPVVANEHPEHRLVLSESGAGVCVPWSAEGFAQATSKLLADPDAARKMGRKGLPWVVRNRAYDHIAKGVMQEYERLLGI